MSRLKNDLQVAHSTRKITLAALAVSITLAFAPSTSFGQDKFFNTKGTIKNVFWPKIHPDGGKTFYCKKKFTKPSVMITVLHPYYESWVRNSLNCGTRKQCLEKSKKYNQIMSDMHNMQPVSVRFALKTKNSFYDILDERLEIGKCKERTSYNNIEPPSDIKGNIARTLMYMHITYGLPMYQAASMENLRVWNKNDPPDSAEIQRNDLIASLQGNSNIFITSPNRGDRFKIQ